MSYKTKSLAYFSCLVVAALTYYVVVDSEENLTNSTDMATTEISTNSTTNISIE